MKLNPLGDRLVAKTPEVATQTASGFYIPDSAKEKPQVSEVVAVGDEVKGIKVGDKIVYSQYKPDLVNIDKQEFLILKAEDVLATVKG